MTIRNLHSMFNPSSVVLVGASQKPDSIGAVLARNLAKAGFKGDIFPVSAKYHSIEGLPTYPDVDSLPKVPDLAVIATPPDTVVQLIEKLGGQGTRAAVVITAGFHKDTMKMGNGYATKSSGWPVPVCCGSWGQTAWESWCPVLD